MSGPYIVTLYVSQKIRCCVEPLLQVRELPCAGPVVHYGRPQPSL